MLPEDKKTGFSIFKGYESLSGILLPFESGASLAFLIILLKGEHVLFFLGGLATKREGKFFSCVCWGRGGRGRGGSENMFSNFFKPKELLNNIL